MYHSKTRFLLVLCGLCAIISNANAVPSVRVLGANNAGIKPVAAKTGTTTANTSGTVKKASVKTAGVAPKQQTLTTNTSSNTSRLGTAASVGRLPVIATKGNLQTGYKQIGSVSTVSTSNAKMDEFSEKLDALQLDIDKKADSVDLENYYTRTEVDEQFDSIDTAGIIERVAQNESDIEDLDSRVEVNDGKIVIMTNQINDINTRINNIDTISSVEYVRELQNRINGYELQLNEVVASNKKIYDAGTNTFRTVRIADNFDSGILSETND